MRLSDTIFECVSGGLDIRRPERLTVVIGISGNGPWKRPTAKSVGVSGRGAREGTDLEVRRALPWHR